MRLWDRKARFGWNSLHLTLEFVRFRAICDFGDFLDEEFIFSVNFLKDCQGFHFFLNSMIFVSRARPEILADAKGTVSSRTKGVVTWPHFHQRREKPKVQLFDFFAPKCENELKSVNFSENAAFRARARRGLLNQWNINGFGAPWGRKCTFGVQRRIFAKKSHFCGI